MHRLLNIFVLLVLVMVFASACRGQPEQPKYWKFFRSPRTEICYEVHKGFTMSPVDSAYCDDWYQTKK